MLEDSTIKTLLGLAFRCSPGDLSMLEVAVGTIGEHRLLTSQGSANFHFWSACVEAGLMERHTDEVTSFPHGEMRSPSFNILSDRRDDMSDLWAHIRHHYDPRAYHMSKLYNELCLQFVENFQKGVKDGGGKDDDIETLVSLLLQRLICSHYSPQAAEDKLMLIGARTRQLLRGGLSA